MTSFLCLFLSVSLLYAQVDDASVLQFRKRRVSQCRAHTVPGNLSPGVRGQRQVRPLWVHERGHTSMRRLLRDQCQLSRSCVGPNRP